MMGIQKEKQVFPNIRQKSSYDSEEDEGSSSNQGDFDTDDSEDYSSSDETESMEEFESESGSDFSIDDVLMFEPISKQSNTLPSTSKIEDSAKKFDTSFFETSSFSNNLNKQKTNTNLRRLEPTIETSILKSVMLSPSVSRNQKTSQVHPNKITKEEIKKFEQQNDKLKNKFGFIRREDFLFCCFTSSKTKTLRFYKRLIVLEEGSILCHLTSSSNSFLYHVCFIFSYIYFALFLCIFF